MLSRLLSSEPFSPYIVLFFIALAVWFFFVRSSRPRDIREPVSIPPRIPVIGHAISLFLHGSDYYDKLKYITFPHQTPKKMRPY